MEPGSWPRCRIAHALPSSPAKNTPLAKKFLLQLVRLSVTGAVFGVAAAIAKGNGPAGFWKAVTLGGLAYSAIALVACGWLWRVRRKGPSFWSLISGFNALTATATIIGITPGVGRSTGRHQFHRQYSTLPVAAYLASRDLRLWNSWNCHSRRTQRRGRPGWVAARRAARVLMIVVGSVGLFLILASVPGELGRMDVFHEGEGLVPARLLLQGDFPWRDFIWAHGLLEDTYRDVIGMLLFDNSRWGAAAGFTLILFPLYCVFLYMLYIYLFGKSWPLLVAGAILFFSQFSGPAHFRFIFWPLVLLLLAAVLNKASPIRTAAFTVALFVEAIITPEAVFTLPGCGAVIVLYEVSHFRRDRNLLSNFRRTVGCLLVGLVLTMAFAVYLVTHGALQAFLDYYRINSQGHAYTGGLAFGDYLRTSVNPNLDIFAVVAPVMALAVALWYLGLKHNKT